MVTSYNFVTLKAERQRKLSTGSEPLFSFPKKREEKVTDGGGMKGENKVAHTHTKKRSG